MVLNLDPSTFGHVQDALGLKSVCIATKTLELVCTSVQRLEPWKDEVSAKRLPASHLDASDLKPTQNLGCKRRLLESIPDLRRQNISHLSTLIAKHMPSSRNACSPSFLRVSLSLSEFLWAPVASFLARYMSIRV